jgi:DNA-binding NarL/FixJ family response regulator
VEGGRTRAGSVVIVDDDERFRTQVAHPLERAGFEVREFDRGEEALEDVCRRPPLVVLLEVCLPGMCGYEVCRMLREELGDGVSIAFVSGDRTEERDRVAGLLLGADDYLAKPLASDEALARVRALARRLAQGRQAPLQQGLAGGLTRRELEVLSLLAEGRRQSAIAERLVISPKTVAGHIERILRKLGVHSRAEAVAAAYRENLVP